MIKLNSFWLRLGAQEVTLSLDSRMGGYAHLDEEHFLTPQMPINVSIYLESKLELEPFCMSLHRFMCLPILHSGIGLVIWTWACH